MKKTSIKPIILLSFDEVDKNLLELGRCETIIQHHESVMNDAIQRVRDEFDVATREAREKRISLCAGIEKFATEHKDEFERPRSRDLTHGTIGFQTSPPFVAQLNRKYSWKTILQLTKKFRWAQNFIRTKEEVDKEKILAAYAGHTITDERLAALGMKVDQKEEFNISIKWDSIEE